MQSGYSGDKQVVSLMADKCSYHGGEQVKRTVVIGDYLDKQPEKQLPRSSYNHNPAALTPVKESPACIVNMIFFLHSDKVSIRLKNYACIISVGLEHVYTPSSFFLSSYGSRIMYIKGTDTIVPFLSIWSVIS